MAGVGQNNFHVPLYLICRKKPLIQYGSIWGSCERVSRLRSMRTWGSLWCFIPSRQAAEYNNGTQIQVSSLSLRRTFATSGMEWCKSEVGIKIRVFSAVKMLGKRIVSTRQASFVSYPPSLSGHIKDWLLRRNWRGNYCHIEQLFGLCIC